MQIVIDMSEYDYNFVKRQVKEGVAITNPWKMFIANGTPLPEHGRLIDADRFKEKYPTGNLTLNNTLNRIIDAEPTVLEGGKK